MFDIKTYKIVIISLFLCFAIALFAGIFSKSIAMKYYSLLLFSAVFYFAHAITSRYFPKYNFKFLLPTAILLLSYVYTSYIAYKFLFIDDFAPQNFSYCEVSLTFKPSEKPNTLLVSPGFLKCDFLSYGKLYMPYVLLTIFLIVSLVEFIWLKRKTLSKDLELTFAFVLAMLIFIFLSLLVSFISYFYFSRISYAVSSGCAKATYSGSEIIVKEPFFKETMDSLHSNYISCFGNLTRFLMSPHTVWLLSLSTLFLPLSFFSIFLGFYLFRKKPFKDDLFSTVFILLSIALWYAGFVAFFAMPLHAMQSCPLKEVLSFCLPALALATYGIFVIIFKYKG